MKTKGRLKTKLSFLIGLIGALSLAAPAAFALEKSSGDKQQEDDKKNYERRYDENGRPVERHRDRDYDRDRNRDRDRGSDRHGDRSIYSCSSNNYRHRTCSIRRGTIDRVRVYDRNSDASCRLGYSWGYSRSVIWVREGCSAEFQVTFYEGRRRLGRTGYESPRHDDYGDRRYEDRRPRDRGYDNRGHGHNRYDSYARRAIETCKRAARRELIHHEGYHYANFQHVDYVRERRRGYEIELTYKVQGHHRRSRGHYEQVTCTTGRNGTYVRT